MYIEKLLNHFKLNKILIPLRSIGDSLPDEFKEIYDETFETENKTSISTSAAVIEEKAALDPRKKRILVVFHGGPLTSKSILMYN